MRYLRFTDSDSMTRCGKVVDGKIIPYAGNVTMVNVITIEQNGALVTEETSYDMDAVKIEAPIIPSKMIAIGRNYGAHAAELGNKLPEKPLIFAKYPSSIIADGETIRWSDDLTQQVDWEAELAVIIGKRGKNIPEESAYDYVFGYTVANDVTARDLQSGDGQWTRGKGLDTFCPLGKMIVSKDEIPDPHDLKIRTTVSGELMQDGHTSDMVFKIPYLIAYCSRAFTLEVGDILLTGTPDGVGKGMNPPRFLTTGDEVSVEIEGIGKITNPCQIETTV